MAPTHRTAFERSGDRRIRSCTDGGSVERDDDLVDMLDKIGAFLFERDPRAQDRHRIPARRMTAQREQIGMHERFAAEKIAIALLATRCRRCGVPVRQSDFARLAVFPNSHMTQRQSHRLCG